MKFVFDGSLKGLLSAIFTYYSTRQKAPVRLISRQYFVPDFFDTVIDIKNDDEGAERVWKGLEDKIGHKGCKNFYRAFLSESQEVYQHLLDYAVYIFDHPKGFDKNYGNSHVLAIAQAVKSVRREKHRMEAFIRFQKDSSGLFFEVVSPDFNVLPLIIRHFKSRYADQPWLIYDEKRKYGIYYNLQEVVEVEMNVSEVAQNMNVPTSVQVEMDPAEKLYARLWKSYFESTNIKERKNMKLHLQFVPKRYWKYLTEKRGV